MVAQHPQVLTSTEEVAAFCAPLHEAPFITIDTEFMRDATYWPRLCLIQIAGPDEAVAAIDPLAEGIDLTAVFRLLADPDVLKVFHAGRQDLEIFYHLAGQVPAPIFDTQVAAMVCGYGENIGYETLVAKIARAKLDKASRFTDWSRRPLSERQIAYALGDVIHLRTIYRDLIGRLTETDRGAWLEDEMGILTAAETYRLEPAHAWERLKTRSDDPAYLAVLREAAAWREEVAQRRDIPRGRVMKDEVLVDIAGRAPTTPEELERSRGLSSGFARSRDGKELLAAIQRGRDCPPDARPHKPKRRPPPSGTGAVVDLLKVLLKHCCDTHDVAPKLIASSQDLEEIAMSDEADVPALSGWRYQLFGQQALALKRGELAIRLGRRGIDIFAPDRERIAAD